MRRPIRRFLLACVVSLTLPGLAGGPRKRSHVSQPQPGATDARETGCSPYQRRQTLRAMQEEVFRAAPPTLDSLNSAVARGGPLAGWRLSNGHIVLAGSGAEALDNVDARDPMPQLLLYARAPKNGLYRLVGWDYVAAYEPASGPPHRPCIADSEWFIHEAGWHTKDGGMILTPRAAEEPLLTHEARQAGVHYWHPRAWDIHVWAGAGGVPTISFTNPGDPGGGRRLPAGAFIQLVEGQEVRLPNS